MAYVISEQNLERQKLLASIMGPVTDRLLGSLPLPSPSRCLDVGCGMGETTRQLAGKLDNAVELMWVDLLLNLI